MHNAGRFSMLLVVMLVEGLSYSMFIPLIPDLFGTKQHGGATTFGLVQSVANAFALIFGLVLGRLADLHGAKPMLAICQVFAAIGSGLFCAKQSGYSASVAFLGLICRNSGRQASRMLAKAYVVRTEAPARRPARLAVLMSLISLGFAGGSSLAGVLSLSPAHALVCSLSLAVAGCTCTTALLPGDGDGENDNGTKKTGVGTTTIMGSQPKAQTLVGSISSALSGVQSGVKGAVSTLMRLIRTRQEMAALLAVRVLTTLGFHFFVSMFTPYATARFRWTRTQLGYCLTFIGLCFACVNGIVVPPLTRLAQPRTLLLAALWALVGARLSFCFAAPHLAPCRASLVVLAAGSNSSSNSSSTVDASSKSMHACMHCPPHYFPDPDPAPVTDAVGTRRLEDGGCVQGIVPLLVAAQILVAVGGGLLQTLMAAELSRLAEPHGCVGLVLGVSEAVKSASGVVAPALAGSVYEQFGPGAPAGAAAVLTACACVILHMVATEPGAETETKQVEAHVRKKDT